MCECLPMCGGKVVAMVMIGLKIIKQDQVREIHVVMERKRTKERNNVYRVVHFYRHERIWALFLILIRPSSHLLEKGKAQWGKILVYESQELHRGLT